MPKRANPRRPETKKESPWTKKEIPNGAALLILIVIAAFAIYATITITTLQSELKDSDDDLKEWDTLLTECAFNYRTLNDKYWGLKAEQRAEEEINCEKQLDTLESLQRWHQCRDHAWDICGVDTTPILYNDTMKATVIGTGIPENILEDLDKVVEDMHKCWDELAEECDQKYFIPEEEFK